MDIAEFKKQFKHKHSDYLESQVYPALNKAIEKVTFYLNWLVVRVMEQQDLN